ncbi:MAG TPA: hypothetical protein VHZ55_29925, partial [Bryobacteraceae bacterium]|nr:hypothetical protein [Bryobacteraceae bacterium]
MRTQTGKDSMVTGRKSGQRLSHRLGILLIVLLILTGVELITLAIKWPFTRRESVVSLEQVSETDVQIGKFHMLFVPHPGYIAQDVTFRRDSALSNRPLV